MIYYISFCAKLETVQAKARQRGASVCGVPGADGFCLPATTTGGSNRTYIVAGVLQCQAQLCCKKVSGNRQTRRVHLLLKAWCCVDSSSGKAYTEDTFLVTLKLSWYDVFKTRTQARI